MTTKGVELEYLRRQGQAARPLTNTPELSVCPQTLAQKLEQENVRQVEVVRDAARERVLHPDEVSQVVPGHAAIVGRQEAFQVRPEVVHQLEEGLAKRCGGFHG